MPALPSRTAIARLMNIGRHSACPCHSCRSGGPIASHAITQFRKFATPVDLTPQKEYAFEVAASNLRFGAGVTREVGMDFANMKATKASDFMVQSRV
jgi:hydroxyacid-oxoacid transhydrogenase